MGEALLALYAVVPLGFAFWGQHAWRKGHRKALWRYLLGAIAAGAICWAIASLRWFDGPDMLVNTMMLAGNVFWLGPGLGLLAGLMFGLLRGPVSTSEPKP